VQAAIAVVCLLPLVPRLPFPTSRWDIPPFFRSPGKSGIPDGALIALGPYPAVSKPQAQMWLAVAGARWRSAGGAYFVPDAAGKVTIGGTAPASAVVETGLEAGIVPPRSERPTVVLQLIRDRVEAVVIGPVSHRDVVLRWWSQLLGPPRTEGGVAVFDVPTS
jgi:hypothetical protein